MKALKAMAVWGAAGLAMIWLWGACASGGATTDCQRRALARIIQNYGENYPRALLDLATKQCFENPNAH